MVYDYLDKIVPDINNWAVCDTIHNIKIIKKNRDLFYNLILKYKNSNPNDECIICKWEYELYQGNCIAYTFTAEYYIDLFGKTAEALLKMNAGEYRKLLIDRNDDKINELTGNIQYKEFYFILKVKNQEYNDVIKRKFTATKIEELDCLKESMRLLEEFKEKKLI